MEKLSAAHKFNCIVLRVNPGLTRTLLWSGVALQCENGHLVAITTITAHMTTIIHIMDFIMKLQNPKSSVIEFGLFVQSLTYK